MFRLRLTPLAARAGRDMPMTETTLPPRFNPTESDERWYLDQVTDKIEADLEEMTRKVGEKFAEMLDLKTYLQNSKSDMDHVEKVSVRQSVDMMSRIGEHGVAKQSRLFKLLNSPYFGRIDIHSGDNSPVLPLYIGMHSFHDPDSGSQWIHDWRAPISSMFYEFELGAAHYDAPDGRTGCTLVLKRQYRIEKREFVFMLESSLNIQDDVLQKELSRASDDQMRNIVATIQRDQNSIIRNDQSHTLIIQGAAGSGKTSIALHRIAFLLYKFKDTISSNEILIISPNKVFAHYISQVLPELGEEMIQETTMETLASELLGHQTAFQTFSEQVSILLRGEDETYGDRIRFKATSAFLEKLDNYSQHVRNTNVRTGDLKIGRLTIDSEWLAARFRSHDRLPVGEQISEVIIAISNHLLDNHKKEINAKERAGLRGDLKRMFSAIDLKTLYKNFYTWLGVPLMLRQAREGGYEYSDVFPLIHLKMRIDGTPPKTHIKHLVIDEMQDYTPVQYRVIARLYLCRKTILGDHNQSVNPLSSSSAEAIREILPQAECIYMHKSYRSTLQITRLAQRIHRNPDLIPIERHGEPPAIIACDNLPHEISRIRGTVESFLASGFKSLGIICKTQDQADYIHKKIADGREEFRLLDARSTVFSGGVIIATAYLAKGLEFDEVIVPFCNGAQYHTVIDRHMLYVACTRAMHKLTLTHTAGVSPFLSDSVGVPATD